LRQRDFDQFRSKRPRLEQIAGEIPDLLLGLGREGSRGNARPGARHTGRGDDVQPFQKNLQVEQERYVLLTEMALSSASDSLSDSLISKLKENIDVD